MVTAAPSYRPSRGVAVAWLFGIARNVVSANLPGQAATGQTGWTAVQQQLAAAKAASVPGLGLVFDPRQHGLKLDPRIG